MHVYVQKAKPITVYADGGVVRAYTLQPTVRKGIQGLGLTLGEMDIVRPALDTPIRAPTTVRIVRVGEDTLVEEEVVDYPVLLKPSADLEIDHQKVVQQGREGLRKRIIKIRYEDGREVKRWVDAEWIERPPVPKITLYGTKIVWRQIDTPEGPVKYWRKLRMLATAYDADGGDKPKGHPAYGITRTGMKLRRGIVAVDPRLIPLYTRLYVPGYGLAIAGDTGGAIKGNRIDLGFELGGAARRWGVRWVDVYVLD
jgi:3D (Asp-Asp-Asp) domain-containing protein